MKTLLSVLLSLATVAIAFPAVAADTSDYQTFAIHFEDDIFYHTDRDYTSGQTLAWTTKSTDKVEQKKGLEDDIARLERRILRHTAPDTADDEAQHQDAITSSRAAFSLGQYIYTPTDITVANPPPGEHPYGGFLYVSAGLLVQTPLSTSFWGAGEQLEQFNVQLGVTGPLSLAHNAMTFVHSVVPNEITPKGWDTQIKTEPGLVVTYERAWRRTVHLDDNHQLQIDPHLGGAVGNIFTYANAGGMLRFGYHVPNDFGPVRLNPALPGSSYFGGDEGKWGWYVFAGVDTRFVARNIFLDGNTWATSRSVDKNPFVTDVQWGAALTIGGFRITYSHVYRTQEFKTQRGPDQFGAVSVAFRLDC